MYTVLENECLRLRPDTEWNQATREDILSSESVVEEDYFVAPPGNIPLVQEDKKYHGSSSDGGRTS